jgi:hypothetical protein
MTSSGFSNFNYINTISVLENRDVSRAAEPPIAESQKQIEIFELHPPIKASAYTST